MKVESQAKDTGSGLNPIRTVLENGAVFIGKRTSMTPAVTISLAVRAGSMCDPPDAVGATWLAHAFGLTAGQAWDAGVKDFLIGDAIKILLAAGLLPSAWKLVDAVRR